jgi:hypothetical protein
MDVCLNYTTMTEIKIRFGNTTLLQINVLLPYFIVQYINYFYFHKP